MLIIYEEFRMVKLCLMKYSLKYYVIKNVICLLNLIVLFFNKIEFFLCVK